ncbi:MAG: hypothetical protein ABR608_09865 [Pseudonocardiaceae bacterium]
MTAPHSTTDPHATTRKIDLSLTQVAAAALAAVTAAVLGSRLGVAGTLIGAAGASVITTVGTAVYRISLERSRERVRALARRTRPLPVFREGSRTERTHPAADNAAFGDQLLTTGYRSQPWERSRRFATLRWGAVVMGALGAFVLGMMIITGIEWASGDTIGDNGAGTTLGRVINAPPAGPPNRPIPPAPHSSRATPSDAPTDTTRSSDTTSTTTSALTPDGDASAERRPSKTSDTPAPSQVKPTPPPIPTRFPAPGAGPRDATEPASPATPEEAE